MNRVKIFLGMLWLILSSISSYSQDENCELTLVRASDEFASGHFYLIPSILGPCLNNFTQEQQLRAQILLTQTYLLLDDPIGAKQSYLKILRVNPEFVADENIHPSDFVYLSKKFITSPVMAWFGKIGVNTAPIRVIHDQDAFDANATEKYHLKPGYQASLGGDVYINDRVGIRTEFKYTFLSFGHTTANFFQDDRKEFFENQSWASVPVSVMYSKPLGKYRPYAYGGLSVNYLFRDLAGTSIEKVRTAEDERDDQQSPDWDFLYKRNQWNYSLFVGGGMKIKMGLRYFFLDARYSMGLKNVVYSSNLYVDNDMEMTSDAFVATNSPTFSFAHVDDYFRIDNMSFSIGYLWPIYKPREIKPKKKTFSFLKKKVKNSDADVSN
jgi:hypothetical protein